MREFDTYVLNPLVVCSNRQKNIRKVKSDKNDALNIAYSCKYQDLKVSQDIDDIVYTLKILCREYYNYTDMRSDQIKKLKTTLKVIFPGFLKVFSTLNTKTVLAILEKYPSPDDILNEDNNEIINLILEKSKKGKKFAIDKYTKLYF
ncbi:IS110 family transposase [Intestinibacter bartlettii]|uniref:IS110 family transposase n=1 Tax=Intestinibacter bartlettii TaxID=261299 RepID=UPI002ED20640